MKKIILVILFFSLTTTAIAQTSNKIEAVINNELKIIFNGEEFKSKEKIVVIDGVTYLPLREVSELLNIKVDYNKGVIQMNTSKIYDEEGEVLEDEIKKDILQTKINSVDEEIKRITNIEKNIEDNIFKRKENNLDVYEAEKELNKLKNDIMLLEEEKNKLLVEMEELINGN